MRRKGKKAQYEAPKLWQTTNDSGKLEEHFETYIINDQYDMMNRGSPKTIVNYRTYCFNTIFLSSNAA